MTDASTGLPSPVLVVDDDFAEGIETQSEADTLHRLGIELGQGYLYGRPEPLAAAPGT